MNEAAKINVDISVSLIAIGITLLLCCLGVWSYKNVTGYTEVKFYKNVDKCGVSTEKIFRSRRTSRHRHSRYSYYVTVITEDEDISFAHQNCRKEYYDGFQRYLGQTVPLTFYETKEGRIFPVYIYGCDAKTAEKIYRELDRPTMWYLYYEASLLLGLSLISAGIKAKRTGERYMKSPAPKTPQEVRVSQGMADQLDRLAAQNPYKYGGVRGVKANPHMTEAAKQDESQDKDELTAAEKAALLQEFDELMASGRFKDKDRY